MASGDRLIGDATSRSHSISELTILKVIALILLIFFHSDLAVAYPKIMNPVQWYLLSIFFFKEDIWHIRHFIVGEKVSGSFLNPKFKRFMFHSLWQYCFI